MRGHTQQRADGNDAGAADHGNQDVVRRFAEWCDNRVWQRTERLDSFAFSRTRLPRRAAFHRHETWAETFDAGIVLVAGRLVDRAFAPELGFHRQDRGAVRLHAAVTTTFANGFVDKHPLRGLRVFAFLAAAAFFRGAGLVVDQH